MKKNMSNDYFIQIQGPKEYNNLNEVSIYGSFKIPYNTNGINNQGANILKHVVMVITRTYDGHSVAPFKDIIVFSDDILDDGKTYSGKFQFNISEHTWLEGSGEFYITCSLGTLLSNTIEVKI